MMKLTQAGKDQIRNWIILNHINGCDFMYSDYTMSIWYESAELVYQTGGNYPTISIDKTYSVNGKEVYFLIYDYWMYDDTIDTRIGILDQIDPKLKSKRISDW